MTIFLIITVLVLVAISIWQITKIFELSQPKKVNTQVADDGDNQWNGQLMFAFMIFINSPLIKHLDPGLGKKALICPKI